MKFIPLPLSGAWQVDLEPIADARGFFARTWCAEEARARELVPRFDQCSVSFNKESGTLRGLHWQASPFAETKLVRVTRGSIFDVAIDVRSDSPTFKKWVGRVLDAENRRAMYLPGGFAHGFLTLEPNTEVSYMITPSFKPDRSRGARWDDPAFGIEWPADVRVVSDRDAGFGPFDPQFGAA